MSNDTFIIRKTEDGILIAPISPDDSIAAAFAAIDLAQHRAVVASEEFDIPLATVLDKRLHKILPDLFPVTKPPVKTPAVTPVLLPQQGLPSRSPSPYVDDSNNGQLSDIYIMDGKQQLDAFETARQAIVGGKEMGFSTCTLCQGSCRLKNGDVCPKCRGAGESTVYRTPTPQS